MVEAEIVAAPLVGSRAHRDVNAIEHLDGRIADADDPDAGMVLTLANPPPVCSNGALPDALMNTQYNNFAPRLICAPADLRLLRNSHPGCSHGLRYLL